jgi:transposase
VSPRRLPTGLVRDPKRICEILVGLPDVELLGVLEHPVLEVHIEQRRKRPACRTCGQLAHLKDQRPVALVDLRCLGRPTTLVWHKRRWRCPGPDCPAPSWTEEDDRIAGRRLLMTNRAGRWATEQVGRFGRTVSEVAKELGCDWHTVNETVLAFGELLVDDPSRYGEVAAVGLDEALMVRLGPRRRQCFTTQVVDVGRSQLLDVVPGRSGTEPIAWLAAKGASWRANVRYATLDLSGPYRRVFDLMLPDAVQVADPFHVVKLANHKLDECRRRVQAETCGHRGRKSDPLYRCRRLLTKAEERLDEKGSEKLTGLLRAGDPHGEVATCWHAKEAVRELYAHGDADLAFEWVTRLGEDLQDADFPPEARSLGRTLLRWREEIAAWHSARVTNGPTEGMNNLVKRVKRVAFGMTNFRNYRVRALLYAGRPDWSLLQSVVPR